MTPGNQIAQLAFDELAKPGWVPLAVANVTLAAHHYLGTVRRGRAWADEFGVMVLASPTSRHLPSDWLELTRWCLAGIPNGGSQQWARVRRALRDDPATTVVSYSDPSAGHTGALYRACNWQWAPTWHRIAPPPSGNGSWDGRTTESVKDRWVFALRPDDRRATVLALPPGYQDRLSTRGNGCDT